MANILLKKAASTKWCIENADSLKQGEQKNASHLQVFWSYHKCENTYSAWQNDYRDFRPSEYIGELLWYKQSSFSE